MKNRGQSQITRQGRKQQSLSAPFSPERVHVGVEVADLGLQFVLGAAFLLQTRLRLLQGLVQCLIERGSNCDEIQHANNKMHKILSNAYTPSVLNQTRKETENTRAFCLKQIPQLPQLGCENTHQQVSLLAPVSGD